MTGMYEEKKVTRRSYAKKQSISSTSSSSNDNPATSFTPIYRPTYAGKKGPYACSSDYYHKCCAWLSCVLLPEGTNSDYKINITHPKQLKMEQKVKLLLVYWDFIISVLADIEEGYKLFYAMLGSDIRNILSLNIRKDSVLQLQGNINESLALWEGLFPIKENYFQLHELVDIVSSIPLFGPPAGTTDLSGERALQSVKKIKKLSNPGGVSFEGNVIERHMFRERDRMRKFYSIATSSADKSAANHESNVYYDEKTNIIVNRAYFSFGLLKRQVREFHCGDFLQDVFEINKLVDILLLEVKRLCNWSEEICFNESVLYQIMTNPQISSNYSHFHRLAAIRDDMDLDFEPKERSLAINILSLNKNIEVYNKATIYGIEFTARGTDCREKTRPEDLTYGAQRMKKTTHFLPWWNKKEISSWCCFEQETKMSQFHKRYGQLNCFFQLNIGDKCLDNILLASVTAYHFRSDKYGNVIVDYEGSIDDSRFFVGLHDIYPTKISLLAFNDTDHAISIKKSGPKNYKKFVRYHTAKKNPKYYRVFILQPENLNMLPKKRSNIIYRNKLIGDIKDATETDY